jgi:glycosyltransferase involved in cell wall biosynthesis
MRQNKQNQIIYFFPDPQIGGVEKNFFTISKYLSTLFKHTFLISGNQINKKIDKNIKLIMISNFWSYINRRLLFIICSIKLFLVSSKFEKSIIFSFQGNFYAIIVSILLKRKIVIRSNLSPQGWKSSPFKIKVFKYLLSKANLIIVNSNEFQKEMKKTFGINAITIFNPTNVKELKRLSAYKKKISFFKKTTINLINVGRLVKQKNQIDILQALIKLKTSIVNYRLLIIGHGPEKIYLQNFILRNKLKKYVKIISVQNPYKYIKMSDVFILSSKYEGLPNVLLEAAYLNKYIISSNCKTGPKEIIKKYKYGKLYKIDNVNDLSSKLKKLNKIRLSSNKKNFSASLTIFNYKKNLIKYSDAIKKLL